jgi:hypothetical protein
MINNSFKTRVGQRSNSKIASATNKITADYMQQTRYTPAIKREMVRNMLYIATNLHKHSQFANFEADMKNMNSGMQSPEEEVAYVEFAGIALTIDELFANQYRLTDLEVNYNSVVTDYTNLVNRNQETSQLRQGNLPNDEQIRVAIALIITELKTLTAKFHVLYALEKKNGSSSNREKIFTYLKKISKLIGQLEQSLKQYTLNIFGISEAAANNHVVELTRLKANSITNRCLINFLYEPDFEFAVDPDSEGPQIGYSQEKRSYYLNMDGKQYHLQLRKPKQLCRIQEKIKEAERDDGKISWNTLNKYFTNCERSRHAATPDSGKILASKAISRANSVACTILDHLKAQGRDQILVAMDNKSENQEHLYYYNRQLNRLVYLEVPQGLTSLDEISAKLKTDNIHELFPAILHEQVSAGIRISPEGATVISLPKHLVNYMVEDKGNTALLKNKNLKYGLNVSSKYFTYEELEDGSVCLEFNLAGPKSCIQHTEYLLDRAHGKSQAVFDYSAEAKGADEVADYQYDIVGSYWSQASRQKVKSVPINFSHDDIIAKISNKKTRPMQTNDDPNFHPTLPHYGQGLALLATEVDRYLYNIHFTTCLGVIAGYKGEQIGSLMSDVSEAERFLDKMFGEEVFEIQDSLPSKLGLNTALLDKFSDQPGAAYSGLEVTHLSTKKNQLKSILGNADSVIRLKPKLTNKTAVDKQIKLSPEGLANLQSHPTTLTKPSMVYLFYSAKEGKLYWLALHPNALKNNHLTKENELELVDSGDFIADKLPEVRNVAPFVISNTQDFYDHQQGAQPQDYFQCVLVEAQERK